MLLNQSSPPLVRTIGNLLAEKLLVEVHSPEDDLLATGVLDSHSLIELLLNLEQHFGMKIPLDELQIEDVRSVRSMLCRLLRAFCFQFTLASSADRGLHSSSVPSLRRRREP